MFHHSSLPVLTIEDNDHPHEECAVFGVWNASDAAALTTLGLHALQHRGQEASGIICFDPKIQEFRAHHGFGLVGDTFSDPHTMEKLQGTCAIGHNRYGTSGPSLLRNVQPIFAEFVFGGLAVAHNGNLTNARALRRNLIQRGCLFQSTMDTEVFVHLIATSLYTTVEDKLIDALKRVMGAYSLVVLSQNALIGARDPFGIRPLVLGRLPTKQGHDSWVLASETCGLDIIGAEFVRDIDPGEIIIIGENGPRSIHPFDKKKPRFCVFEYIYFARPDTFLEGLSVYNVRKEIGRELAKESPVDADMVVPVPDSGVPAAIGYTEASHLPFELGIIRNHYIGRTFIEPSDHIRHLGVKMKHSPNRAVLEGKRVILVDDSIVRGTTSRKIVDMVRAAGAKEVHMRISSPPTEYSCFYGIDTPERSKLLAVQHDLQAMTDIIGVESLAFISHKGLERAIQSGYQDYSDKTPCKTYCDACFTGNYPIALVDHDNRSKDTSS
ncbi:MAG: amidophosphoribosyltransferase [Acetobacter sp.]|nr:amidophosphoribosyltransferase [Acetobacter sp.]